MGGVDDDFSVSEPARAVTYMTLAQVRALECNGCGDCCDSRRTDGSWTWAALPEDQYRSYTGGSPLILPLELVEAEWRDRAYDDRDGGELSGTRFRCAAFEALSDGTGRCTRHTQPRPPVCASFPVWGDDIEQELREYGEAPLNTSWLPRCTWHRMTVVPAGDPRLEQAARGGPLG